MNNNYKNQHGILTTWEFNNGPKNSYENVNSILFIIRDVVLPNSDNEQVIYLILEVSTIWHNCLSIASFKIVSLNNLYKSSDIQKFSDAELIIAGIPIWYSIPLNISYL